MDAGVIAESTSPNNANMFKLFLHKRTPSVDPWANPKWISDHPSVTGLYGMLPGDGVDLETMQRTYDKVLQTWPRYKWGWDYGMMAMAAARLGRCETALDMLLHPNNRFSTNGINHGWYFPGNGALLYAVAMMAAGWDGGPQTNAPRWFVRGGQPRQLSGSRHETFRNTTTQITSLPGELPCQTEFSLFAGESQPWWLAASSPACCRIPPPHKAMVETRFGTLEARGRLKRRSRTNRNF